MYSMSSGNESNAEPMSTDMLENIHDSSQSHSIINRRETRYKICYSIKRSQAECKIALLYAQNMDKGLHKACRLLLM